MIPTQLTPAAIKSLHEQSAADVPKKLDLVLQVLRVDDVHANPEKKEAAKIK